MRQELSALLGNCLQFGHAVNDITDCVDVRHTGPLDLVRLADDLA